MANGSRKRLTNATSALASDSKKLKGEPIQATVGAVVFTWGSRSCTGGLPGERSLFYALHLQEALGGIKWVCPSPD